uniref:Uncharacterized protein n=1 Tax=Meloidogyne javanica TaxID=6303 RepID=A0A915LFV0_MELJA
MPIICRCLHNRKETDKTTESSKGKIIQFSPLCGCTLKCLKCLPLKVSKKSCEKENMDKELNVEKEKVETKIEKEESKSGKYNEII